MCQPTKYENPSTHALVGELISVGSSLCTPEEYGHPGPDQIDHGLEHLRSAQQMLRQIDGRIKKARSSIGKLLKFAEEMKSHPQMSAVTMVDADIVCEKLTDLWYEVEGITERSEGWVEPED